jgi:hypothetical protein
LPVLALEIGKCILIGELDAVAPRARSTAGDARVCSIKAPAARDASNVA